MPLARNAFVQCQVTKCAFILVIVKNSGTKSANKARNVNKMEQSDATLAITFARSTITLYICSITLTVSIDAIEHLHNDAVVESSA